MKRNLIPILLGSALFASSVAGTESEGIACEYASGKEKVKITLYFESRDLLRIRFPGSEPDRFYAATGEEKPFHFVFTEFARKADQKSPLKLGIEKKSALVQEVRMGGNLYALRDQGSEINLKCEHPLEAKRREETTKKVEKK